MTIESAFDRIVRILVMSIGIGSVVFSLLGLPAILSQSDYLDPVFSAVMIVVYCGLPPVLALVSSRVPVPVLRLFAGLHAGSTLLFLALWYPSMTTGRLPDDGIPWLINTITVAAVLAAVALPVRIAWLYMFAAAAGSGFLRYAAYGGGDASIAFQDSIIIALFSGVMMSLVQLTLRAGKEQDAASQDAHEAAAATAAAESLERQRTRYHAFTHDDVLATLLSAASNVPGTEGATKRSAERALRKMDTFRDDRPTRSSLTAAELDSLLRSSAKASGVDVATSVTGRDVMSLRIPIDVADALAEALAEALRNSILHAGWADGRTVHRTARADFSAAGVTITVTDDGKGFLARRVGLDRLGVRVSILQRVNSQPGGTATIDSTRGTGTTVTLAWAAQEVPSED